ncbi:MAG: YHYH protein, partial [Cytophagia bacterium]|nr:YHYH protein [Cytophagia bacterium]
TTKEIILEQNGGNLVKIPTTILAKNDLKLALFKIKKYTQIHQNYPQRNNIGNQIPFFEMLNMVSFGYFLIFLLIILLLRKRLKNQFYFLPLQRLALYSFCLGIFILACKTSSDVTPASTTSTTTGGTTTPSTSITKTSTSFIDSAFAPYKSASLATNWDDTYFYVSSNGIPSHNMMVGITSWQQQVPIAQPYTGTNHWSIPLAPVYAATPVSTKTNFMKGAVALAVNGVPIFNALNNRGEDSFLIGELDKWGGHCGKGDDYHYHAAPLHLSSTSGLKPIAFALDGFAVYGAKEPDGSTMKTLDECHGHLGSNNVYHYHGTNDYPYVVGSMKGKVTLDPSTPAPENQIIPQAFTNPLRPALTPLNGASITTFSAPSSNSYLLTYKIGAKTGSVQYSWTNNNLYTFVFTDVDGKQTNATYQRK